MPCLTEFEIATWLIGNGVTPQPYGRTDSPTYYTQFHCPVSLMQISGFVRSALCAISPADELLVHITDWPMYQPHEFQTVNSLRRSIGECRDLIDAPGILVPRSNPEFAVAFFGLAAAYQWNSYLYFPKNHGTLFNWEGELFDFWTCSSETMDRMHGLIAEFSLTGPKSA